MNNLLSEYYRAFRRRRGKRGTVPVPERIDFIIKGVGSGNKVLDLGCRYGDLTAKYVDGNEVLGVDIDQEALELCSKRLGIETRVLNLNEALPFPDGSFDVVVMSEVLEHLPYPEITLSEVRRILGQTGRLVGSVPNGTRLKNRLRFLVLGKVDEDATHLQYFSASSLNSLLKKYFRRVEVRLVAGRFIRISKPFFANYILFIAEK